jgi:NADH:ubiquinone oxidoreductase subunit F (NADH-binding)
MEYPLAVKRFYLAIEQAKEYGLLGKNILDRGFDFDVEVRRGAGAFVSGEETALIASIEGKMSEPRPRPPFPAVKGLWGKPTNINNVETWADIPVIILKGAKWFGSIGTPASKGAKVFSLAGKVFNTGLVEVPMGITLRRVIFDVGGGMPNGKKFKAVQTGGPSGGFIPESLLDLPVDYESLTQAGAIMGSGGMVIMDEDNCMVDVAKYFVDFLRNESCGKCTPCRQGLPTLLQVLSNITNGKGKEGDIELLQEICETLKDAALCGLGQTAPNPVLSTIKYFRDEYELHIREKRCPAHVCRGLIRYVVDEEKCLKDGHGCDVCRKNCPDNAIVGELNYAHRINPDLCTKCGLCHELCRFEAISVE